MTTFNNRRADHQFFIDCESHTIYSVRDLAAFMNMRIGYRYEVYYCLDAPHYIPAGAMAFREQQITCRDD